MFELVTGSDLKAAPETQMLQLTLLLGAIMAVWFGVLATLIKLSIEGQASC